MAESQPLVDRFHSRPAIVVTVGLYGLLLALTAWLGWSFVGKPFPGFLVSCSQATDVLSLGDWPGTRLGLKPYQRVVAVDGHPVHSRAEILVRVRERPVGTPFVYDLQRPDGSRHAVQVPSARFTRWDFVRVSLVWMLGGLLHVLVGAFALWHRPDHPGARAHWRFCLAMGVFFTIAFETMSTCVLPIGTRAVSNAAIPVTVIDLALTFPLVSARRWRWTGVLAVSVLAMLALFALGAVLDAPWRAFAIFPLVVAASLGVLGAGARWIWLALSRGTPGEARSQARIAAFGMLVSWLVPVVIVVGFPLLGRASPGLDLSPVMMSAFPIAVAYAIVRHGAFDIQLVVRRTTVYAATTALLALLYAGVSVVATSVFVGHSPTGPSFAPGFATAVIVAMACRPIYRRLRLAVDRLFIGPRADALRTLAAFGSRLPAEADELARELVRHVEAALAPAWVLLELEGTPVARGGEAPEPPAAPGEGAAAFALVARGEPLGRLLVGPRVNGMPYDREERRLLTMLAAHAGAALLGARLTAERVDAAVREAVVGEVARERREMLLSIVAAIHTEIASIERVLERREGGADRWRAIEDAVGRVEELLAEKSSRLLEEAPAHPPNGSGDKHIAR